MSIAESLWQETLSHNTARKINASSNRHLVFNNIADLICDFSRPSLSPRSFFAAPDRIQRGVALALRGAGAGGKAAVAAAGADSHFV
ncbi:MAG: hypothetical protein HYS33_06760 [Acidobacteria bacterium]|nr:hypothetical protein [Acidobacteriota bacterium]